MLRGYARRKPLRLHMPGHKAEKGFCRVFPGAAEDITELSFSDSLQEPGGVLADAERRVSELLGTKRSFFLTDGSTCGIYCMVYAEKKRGRKIAINRNAHQSVYNACKALGVEPVRIEQRRKNGGLLPPSAEEVARVLDAEPSADVLLTYPDYYGRTFDLAAVRKICDARGRALLIDGAHGGHLRYTDAKRYAGVSADLWVDGVHKTLPCLTQTAVLNVNAVAFLSLAEEAVKLFRTSSPSYPLMASVEYGETFMAEKGVGLFPGLEERVRRLKGRLRESGYGILENNDALKLCVDFAPTGISPYAAEEFLQARGIYAEMNDGRIILFLLGVTTGKRQLRRLRRGLIALLRRSSLRGTYQAPPETKTGTGNIPYLEACAAEAEEVPLEQSAGRTLAENVGTFPPCCPLCVAGEKMTKEVVSVLKTARYVFGVNGGKVKAIKKGTRLWNEENS